LFPFVKISQKNIKYRLLQINGIKVVLKWKNRRDVMTNIGMYDVNFSVGSFGATARLTGLRPGNLTFTGDMVTLKESTIYEGRSL
jgi:hypothetical protein